MSAAVRLASCDVPPPPPALPPVVAPPAWLPPAPLRLLVRGTASGCGGAPPVSACGRPAPPPAAECVGEEQRLVPEAVAGMRPDCRPVATSAKGLMARTTPAAKHARECGEEAVR